MERFYEENKSLFVFVSKNVHSGNNRIDWRRTMRKTPFMQGDPSSGAGMTTPIYMNLVNKKKVFDLDDRLIVLYFSAMNYIEERFSLKMPRSEFYAPMRVNEFRRLMGHKGLMELRRIKHKYFADKFLRLYNIMEAFFEWGANFQQNGFNSEYMLTSKYNNVFEHMIDTLVGDKLPSNLKELKEQKDGKEVDHLYEDQQLIFADKEQRIWFIGDSKYYKDSNDIRGESLYKQFTYAKNVIQCNINDLLNSNSDEGEYRGLRYRDKLTEGYSVTPNFFVRGELPKFENADQFGENYFRKNGNDLLIRQDGEPLENIRRESWSDEQKGVLKEAQNNLWNLRNRHFENRLFDRDTLLLQVYNVNFLYVLKAFTAKGSGLRTEFKRTAREKFRKNFITLLRNRYYFWIVWVKGKTSTFVNDNYRTLQGKIFRTRDNADFLVLALEKDFVQKKRLKEGEPTEFECLVATIKGNYEVFLWDAEDFVNDIVPSKKSECKEILERP